MAAFLKALVTIYAADIGKAVDFYGRVLGFAETYRYPKYGEPEHVEFRIGSATIAVSSPAGLQTHGMPPATSGHPFELRGTATLTSPIRTATGFHFIRT